MKGNAAKFEDFDFESESGDSFELGEPNNVELSEEEAFIGKLEAVKISLDNDDIEEQSILSSWIGFSKTIRPLDPTTEKFIFLKYKNTRDKSVLDEVIISYIPFIVRISSIYKFASYSWIDLIQDGYVALIEAAEKFDSEKGCKFLTYAVWRIRKAMQLSIYTKNHLIVSSSYIFEEINLYRKTKAKLCALGQYPNTCDIAENMGRSENRVEKIRQAKNILDILSLDDFIDDEDEDGPSFNVASEYPSPEDLVIKKSDKEIVLHNFSGIRIKFKNKFVLVNRYNLVDYPLEADQLEILFGLNTYSVEELRAASCINPGNLRDRWIQMVAENMLREEKEKFLYIFPFIPEDPNVYTKNEGWSLKEIGNIFSVGPEAIRQREDGSSEMIRKRFAKVIDHVF